MKIKDAAIGAFVIGTIVFIIIPIPTLLLDFLLMISIGLSAILLLNAIYAKEPLEMSFFPTMLLMTTMLRLSLSICSTRLILGTGEAGDVINAFANFVGGGNLIVGLVIFILIMLVNFLVITKGSERVAEVAARFTLDAMPGKQMAIDADLNAGLIDEGDARARRKKIGDEANFFGSMDGAAKFVKNDAIAGILTTIINIIGGIAIGATGAGTGTAISIGEAFNLYGFLSIGDGLVTSIPSLMTSVATGMLVTKSTSDSEITNALFTQLFNSPLVLMLTGVVMLVLGTFTELPTFFFIPFGIMLIYFSYSRRKQQEVEAIREEIAADDTTAAVDEIRRPESVVSLLSVDPILLLFGYGLIPLVDPVQGGDLLDRVVMIRRQIALELGAIVPIIRLRDDIKLSPNHYRILIKGTEVAGGDILFDHYMAMNPGYVEEEIDGIETVEPYMGLPALWISENQRERAEALGYTVVDPPAIIATHLTEVVREHLSELLSRQDVQTLINNVKEAHPVLVDELVPKLLTIGDVQKVLSNLLKEGISIRDLASILETLADYAHVTRDTDMLTEYVRQALRRSISNKFFDGEVNKVITLDPELEQQIMGSVQQTEQGSYIALDPLATQNIFESLNAELRKLTSAGLQPIILTSPIVRTYFKKLVEQVAPDLVVLSYNEINPNVEVQSVGMVKV